jgi:hypothetical protein
MDGSAFDEMITPQAGEEKRPRDGAADAAGLVFDCELPDVLSGDAGLIRPLQSESVFFIQMFKWSQAVVGRTPTSVHSRYINRSEPDKWNRRRTFRPE